MAKKRRNADVGAMKKRIESAKADLARTEGEQTALADRVEETVKKLRKSLGCKPGDDAAMGVEPVVQNDRYMAHRFDQGHALHSAQFKNG